MTSSIAVISRDWNYPILESRTSLESTQTPLSYPAEWLLDIFNGGRTDSGVRISELSAFQASTFLACVDIISGKISSLPRHVYEKSFLDSGRTVHRIAREHDIYDLLVTEPNEEMNGNTLLKAFLCHCLAWGNGYIEIQRDAGNGIVGLWPRNPGKTRPKRLVTSQHLDPMPWRPFPVNLASGTMVFETTDAIDDEDRSDAGAHSRPGRIIPMEDMLHVPGIAFDGRVGQSVVWLARQTLGLALATEKFGAKYFANFAKPGGILEMPAQLKAEDKEASRRSWSEAQGGDNAHRVAIMAPGFKWQSISNNPQEAQTIDTRKYVRNEICAIFHVPAHMVGEEPKGRSNTEQLAQELKEYCLDPWMSQIRQEWKRKLFPHQRIGRRPKNPFYMDFDLTELLRPDAASREKNYASGKQWGYMNTNDVHALEKMNPVQEPWAEEYWMPVNMTLVTTPIDPTFQDGDGDGVVPPDKKTPPDKKKKTKPKSGEPLVQVYSRLFTDAFHRVLAQDRRNYDAFKRIFGPVLFAIRDAAQQGAEMEMRCEIENNAESDVAILEYLRGMQKRSKDWISESHELIVPEELDRAIRAIRMAAYREVATHKAKEPVVLS